MPISYEYSNGSVLIDIIEDTSGNQVRKTTNSYIELNGGSFISYPIMIYTGLKFTATYPYRVVESSELKVRKFQKIKTTTITEYLPSNQPQQPNFNFSIPENFFNLQQAPQDNTAQTQTKKQSYAQAGRVYTPGRVAQPTSLPLPAIDPIYAFADPMKMGAYAFAPINWSRTSSGTSSTASTTQSKKAASTSTSPPASGTSGTWTSTIKVGGVTKKATYSRTGTTTTLVGYS